MEDKQSRRGYKKMLWLMWFLAVVILVAIAYVFPGISGTLTKTYLAEYDNVRVSDEVECYVVRDEVITYAENVGPISYYYEEGTRVRKNTTVLKVGARSYVEEQTGTVGYYVDGQEEYFDPTKLAALKKNEVENLHISVENLVADTAESGQALYKTIRGNSWYLIFWRDKESVVKYIKGNSVKVLLGDSQITAKVTDIYDQGDEYLVVLKTNRYYVDYTMVRRLDAEIVTVDEQGLKLKAQSLVTIDGQPGVYVKELNGKYTFTPVKIYTLSGENVLVARDSYNEITETETKRVTTVSAYDEILTNGASFQSTEVINE